MPYSFVYPLLNAILTAVDYSESGDPNFYYPPGFYDSYSAWSNKSLYELDNSY